MSRNRTKIYRTFSSEETRKLGMAFAQRAISRGEAKNERAKRAAKRHGAAVFALRGDLGAGKTTFVQGFFTALGIKKNAPSPTFVIMRRHALGRRRAPRTRRSGARQPFKNVFHIDAYRLKKAADLEALDFGKIAADPGNIILIEWADRAKEVLPRGTRWLRFAHGRREHERTIKGVL